MQPAPSLSVRGLSVAYGGAPALTEVSLEIPHGGAVAVLGLNGAGKTTLVRALSGVLPLHRGRVVAGDLRYGDMSLNKMKVHDRVKAGIVHVPEGRHIIGTLTVEENLILAAARVARIGKRRQTLQPIYDLFPVLEDRRNQHAALLSGGQQQMLAMGRAMVLRPRLLLLDEPTMGLSPSVSAEIERTIAVIRDSGTPILLIQQNIQSALELTERAVLLASGRVVWTRPSAEVLAEEDPAQLLFGATHASEPAVAAVSNADSQLPKISKETS
jgi:branched-chain amino acid transport system ATP-binding protein